MIGNEFRRIALAQGLLSNGSAQLSEQVRSRPPQDAVQPICPSDRPAMAEQRDQTA